MGGNGYDMPIMLERVAAYHENDTFWNGLVMGSTDCVDCAGL